MRLGIKTLKKNIALLLVLILSFIYYVIAYRNCFDYANVYLIFLIIMGTISFISAIADIKKEILDLRVLIPLMFILYALGPLMEFGYLYSESIQIEYLKLQSFGILGLIIGCYVPFFNKYQITKKKQIITPFNLEALKITAILIFLLSLASIGIEIRAYGGFETYFGIGYGGERYLLNSSVTIGASFQWFIISAIVLGYYGLLKKRKGFLISSIIIAILAVASFILIGGRSTIIYMVLFGVVLWHYGYKKLPKGVVILGIICGYIFAQIFSIARFYFSSGIAYAFYKGIAAVIIQPELLLPFNIGEFPFPSRSLLDILKVENLDMQYGVTYVEAIINAIPFLGRFIKVDFNLNTWYMTTFYNEAYLAGGGFGFSPVAEGYINFGSMGTFFYMLFYGIIVNFVGKKKATDKKYILLYAGIFPLFLLEGLRIYSASFVYKLTRVYLLPYILYYFLAKFYWKSYRWK